MFRSTGVYSTVVIGFRSYSKKISEYTCTDRGQPYKSQPRWYNYIYSIFLSRIDICSQSIHISSLLCIVICSQTDTHSISVLHASLALSSSGSEVTQRKISKYTYSIGNNSISPNPDGTIIYIHYFRRRIDICSQSIRIYSSLCIHLTADDEYVICVI